VAARRADAAAKLLVAALTRDMRGVQQLLLTSTEQDDVTSDAGGDLLRPIGNALARYPYPQVFFSWRDPTTPDAVRFYSRPERPPAWLTNAPTERMFPVVASREPAMAKRLLARINQDCAEGRRFSVFDFEADGPYQVVAFVSYRDPLREEPAAVLGFMVDLKWTREHYFSDLAAQVARIEGNDNAIEFSVIDDNSRLVVGSGERDQAAARRLTFPMAFFDPLIVAVNPPPDLHVTTWNAVANPIHDPTL